MNNTTRFCELALMNNTNRFHDPMGGNIRSRTHVKNISFAFREIFVFDSQEDVRSSTKY